MALAALVVLCRPAAGQGVPEAGQGEVGPAAEADADLERQLRGRVESLANGIAARADDDRILARAALPAFYEARAFRPAWIEGGTGRQARAQLVTAIRGGRRHGLDPADYHLESLVALDASVEDGTATTLDRVDLDLLATDAFLVLGSHLLHGRVNPETIDPEWLANRRSALMHEVLTDALASGDVASALQGLAPGQARYREMMEAADRLRQVASEGGWAPVPEGPVLEVGVEDPRVRTVRSRLRATGDFESGSPGDDVYDEELAEAVRRFQGRHGLDVDGLVGPATRVSLNVPAAERARQLEINMERWRWLPADLGERHIEVNIAGFDVKVVERGRTVRRHRAVVGRQYRQTPMFSGTMTYLVLAPYWHVPPSIAAVDKLPAIKQDPSMLAVQRMTLLDQRTNERVDPSTVEWASLTGAELNRRYRLRQDPGPANALGNVKFMFPNAHNVYLHDTPSRDLFERTSRSFSSGCIRIDAPLELAEYLLADQPTWTRQRIDETVAGGVERTVRLTSGVPVHLLYWTAWADEYGIVHFRDDIYGRDTTVRRGLDADPPGA